MTVNTVTITSGPYTGAGSADEYSYNFRITDESELRVFETDTLGVETELVLNVDYSVSGVGVDGGGVITRLAGNLPTGYTWYIRSDYDTTQNTSFKSQGGFFPEVHEDAIDKLTFLVQQLYDLNARSFRISESDPDYSAIGTLPDAATRANKVLSFDAVGDLTVAIELGSWRGDWATATDYDVRDLFKDPATNNVYFVAITHTSTSIAADVGSGKILLVVDASAVAASAAAAAASAAAAAISESNAATSESNAATSESNAAASAAAASTSESNAAASAAAAATSESNAAASEAAAAASYDSFDDRYLGAKASDPTLDNDGNPLLTGATYWNTTTNVLKYWTGAAWTTVTASGVTGITSSADATTIVLDANENVAFGGESPRANWKTGQNLIEMRAAALWANDNTVNLGNNTYVTDAGTYYKADGYATRLYSYNGEFVFQVAASGLADDPITWTYGPTINNSGYLTLGDNKQIQLGDGADFTMYHDTTNTYLLNNTGIFRLRNLVNSNNVEIATKNSGGTVKNVALFGGATPSARLLHDGVEKLGTSSTGLNIANNASTEDAAIKLGPGRSGNGYAYIDFIGDATYTSYGFRIIRNNLGANTNTQLIHRGTGNLYLATNDAASIILQTNSTSRFGIASGGGLYANGLSSGKSAGSINATAYYENDVQGHLIPTPAAGSYYNYGSHVHISRATWGGGTGYVMNPGWTAKRAGVVTVKVKGDAADTTGNFTWYLRKNGSNESGPYVNDHALKSINVTVAVDDTLEIYSTGGGAGEGCGFNMAIATDKPEPYSGLANQSLDADDSQPWVNWT